MTQQAKIIVGVVALVLVGFLIYGFTAPKNDAVPNGAAQPKVLGGNAGTPNAAVPNTGTPNPAVTNGTTPPPIVGNDRDAHGCIGSAGYVWCPEKNKCLRTWEEACAHPSLPTKPQPE